MDNKKITIEKYDFIDACAKITSEDKITSELIAENPAMILLFADLSYKTWKELVKRYEGNNED